MLQILEATSYLHRHQIIHRDLKLGNVFLDADWNIKVAISPCLMFPVVESRKVERSLFADLFVYSATMDDAISRSFICVCFRVHFPPLLSSVFFS